MAVPSSARGSSLLWLLVVGTAVWTAAPGRLRRKLGRILLVRLALEARGEHPRVLGATALAGVDNQASFPQRDAGQPAGQHPDPLTVVDGERPQVHVPGHQPIAELGRRGRQ